MQTEQTARAEQMAELMIVERGHHLARSALYLYSYVYLHRSLLRTASLARSYDYCHCYYCLLLRASYSAITPPYY